MCASGANLSKDLVQPHLFSQDADVVKEVRLHVAPHVRKPPEIHSVLQQHVVSPILLISPCKRNACTHTKYRQNSCGHIYIKHCLFVSHKVLGL